MIGTDFAGLPTSRIGFGCGRLVGGASMRSGVALIEAAMALGIRHFDTAPSYGLGTSEDVLGTALAGSMDVTIATKVGQSRPGGGGARSLARSILRPLLASAPGLKARLVKAAVAPVTASFSTPIIRASIEESLRRLRRDQVTAVLLHELDEASVNAELIGEISSWPEIGLTRVLGSGSGKALEGLVAYGDVAQYLWQPDEQRAPARWRVVHGLLRLYPQPIRYSENQSDALRQLGRDPADPATWTGMTLTAALAADAASIILISSNSAERIRSAVNAIDWAMAARHDPAEISAMNALLQDQPNRPVT